MLTNLRNALASSPTLSIDHDGFWRRLLLLLAALAAVLLLAIFYLGGPGLILGDFYNNFVQHRLLLQRSLLGEGVLPLWNPYNFSGHPFYPDFQLAMFYPTMGLHLLLPQELAMLLERVLHMALGALGAARFCRLLGISRGAAAITGLFYLCLPDWFCDTWSGNHQFVLAMAWLPWVYASAEALLTGGGRRWWLAGAFAVGGLVGSGGLQLAWMTLLFLPLYGLLRWRERRARQPGGQGTTSLLAGLRPHALTAGFVLAGAALAAAHWIPALLYTQQSSRAAATENLVAMDAQQLPALAAMVFPDLLAHFVEARYQIFEWYNYPGLLVLVCVVLSLFGRRVLASRSALLLPAGLALLLAVGPTLGLTTLLMNTVPGYSMLRIHCREMILVLFFLLPLAGAGAQALLELPRGPARGRPRRALQIMAVVVVLAAVCRLVLGLVSGPGPGATPWIGLALGALLALHAWRPAPSMVGALLLVSLVDVGAAARELGRFANSDYWIFDAAPGVEAALKSRRGWYRFWGHEDVINVNHGVNLRRRSILGLESVVPGRYAEFIARMANLPENMATTHLSPGLIGQVPTPFPFKILGIRYALKKSWAPLPPGVPPARNAPLGVVNDMDPDDPEASLQRRDPDLRWTLMVNPSPFPRAQLISRYRVLPAGEVLDQLARSGFDPRQEVLLEQQPRWPVAASGRAGQTRVISVTDLGVNRLEVEVESAGRALLLLSEMHYQGWSARLDGEPCPVLRADYLLRAVPIPAGRHTVTMWYRPPGLWPGVFISLGALLLLLAGPWLYRRFGARS